MIVKYFAWVRERVGKPEDEIALPGHVRTARDLMNYLATCGENYAYALEDAARIRVAADHTHVAHDADVRDAREVALFPPMTGG